MLKDIIKLIEEFVLKPAGLTAFVLFVFSFVLLFFYLKNFKKTLILSLLGAFLSFVGIIIFMTLSIKFNEPKFFALTYPFLINLWYFLLKKYKFSLVTANLIMFAAFFSDYYLVEKILFE